MRVIVQSKTLQLTKALRGFADTQAKKLDGLGARVSGVRVYLENVRRKSNDPHAATVKYRVELPGKDIIVRARSRDMYQAILKATNNAARRVRKLKEKRLGKRKHPNK